MKFNQTRWSVPLILVFCVTVLAQARLPVSRSNYKTSSFATKFVNTQANSQLIESLESGKEVTGSVQAATVANDCVLSATQYKIEIVGRDKKLRVVLGADSNVDLYIRRDIPVAIEDGKIVSDFKSNFRGTREDISLPLREAPPLQQGIYFIAVTNCATTASNYKLTATVTGPPDVAILDFFSVNFGAAVGSIPTPVPGNCGISRTQYLLVEGFTPCLGGIAWNITIHADQNVNVLIRKNRPITVENGVFMYDSMGENQVKVHHLNNFVSTSGPATFYLAVLNCGFEPVNYTVSASATAVDVFPPVLSRAFFKKKDLHIEGFSLGEPTVTIDDRPQKVINGGTGTNFVTTLIIKKAKKHIAHGQTVIIVATRSDGCSSNKFALTRP